MLVLEITSRVELPHKDEQLIKGDSSILVEVQSAQGLLDLFISVLFLGFEFLGEILIDDVDFLAIEVAIAVLVVLLEELEDCLADLVVSEGHLPRI